MRQYADISETKWTTMINIGNKRSIFSIIWLVILVLPALVSDGQEVPVPSNLQVPKDSKLILHAYARGVQIYTCIQVPTDTARYTWIFVEPKASLYSKDNYRQQIGKHYFSPDNYPMWESIDGSIVTATKLQQANAPDTSAIPWLLLKATNWTGYGPLRSATLIQRINTKGGKAPADGADRDHKGQFIQVAYTAEYLFYKAGE
jgi:hypothetical protein